MNKARLLIVDDSKDHRDLIIRYLREEDYEIQEVSTGKEAIDKFRSGSFDLVISDIRMAEMSGIELLEELKKIDDAVQVILLTAYADLETTQNAVKYGACDYIVKPTEAKVVLSSVRSALEKAKLLRANKSYQQELEQLTKTLEFQKLALEREQERTRRIIEESPTGILVVDAERGQVFVMNRQAEKMLGVSEQYTEKYFGINYREMFPNGAKGKIEETIERVKETRSTVDMGEYWIRTDYVLGITGYPIISGGIVGSIVITANDITEKKAFEKQLIQSSRLAGIGELAAGVAHEINNPVGFVTSNTNSLGKYFKKISQVLQRYNELHGKKDTMSREEMVSKIVEIQALANELRIDKAIESADRVITENIDGLNRVKKIVRDLKTFSHVSDEKTDEVDVNQILDDTLNLVRNEVKYKAEVVRDYGDVRPINCFSSQLAQVFANIIVNAAQAIEKQGVITIKTYEQNGNAVINISDTGCGMTKETMDNIFNPFFTTKEAGRGTGLGLSITHQIIEKHKGDIRVKSEVGKGTSFEIYLPVN